MQRTLLLLGSWLLVAGFAPAQFPAARPGGSSGSGGMGGGFGSGLSGGIGAAPSGAGFSPYLNLTGGRGTAAVNLYGIVRQQQSLQQGLQNLAQSYIAGNDQNDTTTGPAVIGTRARFLNTGGYFLNLTGGTTPMTSGGGGSFSGPRSGAGGGLSNFGQLPSNASGLSMPQQGSLGGSGTGSFGTPSPKGGGRPSGPSKN